VLAFFLGNSIAKSTPMNLRLLCSLLLFSFNIHAQEIISAKEKEIVFYDVNVITMDANRVLEHQTVVAKNGRITSLGPVKIIKFPKASTVVDGKGKYLIPGLAEMHAHVPPIDDIEPMKEVVRLFAVNGITTIRGMLGHPRHLELRDKIRSGEILSPHFYTTGPSFNGMSVTSPEAGAAMVRKQKKDGYDFLKLHPGLSRVKFDSIAAAAKQVGIPFVGHVSFNVGVWRAIEAGYSSIDHLDGFVEALVPGVDKMVEQQTGLFGMFIADKADTTKIPSLISALKKNNIWVVPTQSLAERWFSPTFTVESFKNDPDMKYMKPETVEQWNTSKTNLLNNPEYNVSKINALVALRKKLIKECQKNGVGLLLGCDAPQIFNVPGFSTHNELEYLVRAGLTPYEALTTGTRNVAKYLNLNDAGIIKKGNVSDLVLLNGNPLADIKQTRNIEGVMIGEKWMNRSYIDGALSSLRKQ
jgi:imidazolonepropionase-like amidohydrolase